MGELRPIPAVSAFDDHENSVFTVEGGHEGHELELVEIDTSADTVDGWERFSLVFEGPVDERLEQGFYRLDHHELGAFDAMLVPVWTREADPDRVQYQAVVDRQVPEREAGLAALGTSSRRGLLGRAALVVAGGTVLGSLFGSEPAAATTALPGSDPMLGGISMFAGNFAPRGYAFCDGQLLPIAQNSALFSLLGTTYGGDGRTTFALPDLRGRVPIHAGQGPGLSPYSLGQKGGVETVALTESQMPTHDHTASLTDDGSLSLPVSSAEGDTTTPDGNVLAVPSSSRGNAPVPSIYSTGTPDGSMAVEGAAGGVTVDSAGGGGAHTNVQPYLAINYVIALQGVFPSRN